MSVPPSLFPLYVSTSFLLLFFFFPLTNLEFPRTPFASPLAAQPSSIFYDSSLIRLILHFSLPPLSLPHCMSCVPLPLLPLHISLLASGSISWCDLTIHILTWIKMNPFSTVSQLSILFISYSFTLRCVISQFLIADSCFQFPLIFFAYSSVLLSLFLMPLF